MTLSTDLARPHKPFMATTVAWQPLSTRNSHRVIPVTSRVWCRLPLVTTLHLIQCGHLNVIKKRLPRCLRLQFRYMSNHRRCRASLKCFHLSSCFGRLAKAASSWPSRALANSGDWTLGLFSSLEGVFFHQTIVPGAKGSIATRIEF